MIAVIAERGTDDRIVIERGHCVAQGCRQLSDAELSAFFVAEACAAHLDGIAGYELAPDAVEARLDDACEREIRVARWIGRAQLDANRITCLRGHAHERALRALRPLDESRRVISRYQPFVRIDRRVGHEREARGMRE